MATMSSIHLQHDRWKCGSCARNR